MIHRRPASGLGLLVGAAACLLWAGSVPATARTYDARLDGTFAMKGTVTSAHNVYGERRGQRVRRQWVFSSSCGTVVCPQVKLTRQRSDRNLSDVMVLKHVGTGTYSGTGQFSVPLRCGRRVISNGGLAKEKIVVRIQGTQFAVGVPFATSISATYRSLSRVNRTACPGGIGYDAAKYSGTRTSPLGSSGGATPARDAAA